MKYGKIGIGMVLLMQSIGISAQSVLAGRVIDGDSIPVADATIMLLNSADSTYITGTISDVDGRFGIGNLKPDNYLLVFSMMGFKGISIQRQVGQNTNNELGDIVLSEESYRLSTVSVIGKRSPVKVEPGKMTINLSSAFLSTDGNMLDVLRKLPGVIVQNDGTIMLNSKSGVNVLVDDKVTYLSGENLINYLRSIPAHSVENIELISQPSSKYDASSSSGIINIQKKGIKEQGINLAVSSGLERGKDTRGNESLTLSFRHSKWTVYADYSSYWGKDFIELSVSGHYLEPLSLKPLELRKDFVSDINRQSIGHYMKTGVDYDVSDKITVGTYFSSNWFNRHKKEVTVSDFFNGDKVRSDSTLTASSAMDYSYTNMTGGANMVYKFAKAGKWDASFDYQLFDREDDQLLKSFFQAGSNPVREDTLSGKTNGDIKIYSGQTNLSYPIAEKFDITTGLKTVFVNIGSKALYKNLVAGNWQEDSDLSSEFSYRENINAAYFQLNAKWSSLFSTEMGFRLENTYTRSNYGSAVRDTAFSKKYTYLFPALTARYQRSENQGFSITYGRRIVRPNYRNMNPFVEVRDQFLYERGNTELRPELIDNIEISWLLKQRFSFNMFYSHRDNPISLSFLVEDNSRVLIMPLNLSGNNSFGLRVGFNNLRPFKWWTAHINGSLTYKHFDWMLYGKTFKNEVATPMLHISNQFVLPYGWGGEVIGFYSGEMIEGQTTVKPLWTVSLGVRKNLLNDKFSLYIYAQDLFHSNRPRVCVDSNYLYYTSSEKNDSRMIGISLSYRFNRGREVHKSQNGNRIEESKRIGL
ncbi:MAG: outer membrane beta-barrel family protein [Parabacteroides sp.]|nr:outer membrane beta-barrel family protein [Parabacteroides sp.]